MSSQVFRFSAREVSEMLLNSLRDQGKAKTDKSYSANFAVQKRDNDIIVELEIEENLK